MAQTCRLISVKVNVAWPYRLQIYYIRDGATPTLSRKILAWDADTESMSIQTEDLVQGVENMRFRFGYDSNDDGEVDTLANVTDVTIADKWDQVTSLQVFLLLASDVSDPNYTNEKTYQLGDIAVYEGDSVRRILLHSDMTLRNRRLALAGRGTMSNPMLNAMKNAARQSGVVLVTGLLFLLVVTIIAVTAANNSTLGLKMSASMQDSYRSFQSAEAGLYAAAGVGRHCP